MLPKSDPCFRDYVDQYGVWDEYNYKGKNFRRLKQLHQKLLRDIMEAALSRFIKRQPIGNWTLDTIKIRDNMAVVPPPSASLVQMNPAKMLYKLASELFGHDGDVPDRDSFYMLLKMLEGMKNFNSIRVCFKSLVCHRLIQSSKENIDFIGNALEHLKINNVQFGDESWDDQYKAWTKHKNYNIREIVQREEYFKRVYDYRQYPDNCIQVLQFLKNLFKHVNEYRENDGKSHWSYEELDILAEYYFPREMRDFYEFLWANELQLDFRKSRPCFPPSVRDIERLVEAFEFATGNVQDIERVVEAFSETLSEFATGNVQVIQNSDVQLIHKDGGTVSYGEWRGCRVALKFEKATSNKQRADFQKRVEILSQLNHPCIVPFYGVVSGPQSTLAIVTEYMINGSLKEVLTRSQNIDHWKKLTIAKNAAIALEYIHKTSSAHFNLTSGNFLLDMRDPELPVCKIGDIDLTSDGGQRNEPSLPE